MFLTRRDPDDALRATLLTLIPALFAPVLTPEPLAARGVPAVVVPALVGAGFAAPSLVPRLGTGVRLVVTAAVLLGASAWVFAHLASPGVGALLLIGAVALLASVWPAPDGSPLQLLAPVPASAATALALVGYGWTASLVGPLGAYGVAGAAFVAGALAVRAASDRAEQQVAWGTALAPIAWSLLVGGGLAPAAPLLPALAVGPVLLLSRSVPTARGWAPVSRTASELLLSSPPRLLVTSFAAAAAAGTVLLALPVSHAQGRGLALVDAAFTAVSAVTVTGLLTIDVTELSGFGRLVLLVLMQLGGLGIMTFAGAAAEWTGTRLGVRQDAVAAQLLGHGARQDLRAALRRVVVVTLVAEGIGAALLLPSLWARGHGVAGIGEAVFLAVSAFCNAGFTPWVGNLVPWARDPWLAAVVAALAVAGSLGPAVLLAAPALARGERVPMWIRLTLVGNAALLAVPFLLLLGLEWTRALGQLPAHDRVAAALLLAVSSRTAGFSPIDLAAIEPATATLLMLLMLVGGNPGSTAGGVKVSTVAVLLLAVAAAVRGRRAAEFGARQIPTRVVYEAIAVVVAGLATVVLGLVLLQLTQPQRAHGMLFEVVSAVSTAGLSTGAAASMDGVGKLVLLGCMFAGRVGPLTLLLLLSADQEREGGSPWPSEEVPVG